MTAMKPWEKRLHDLSHLVRQCHATYMEPELFRLNVNQFLQTSRTVTFIIQKHKESIPDFPRWYGLHVLEPWKSNELMEWAKDARNTVEKEGDLDLNSSVSATLFYGYLENTDLKLAVGDPRLLHMSVKRLIRLARASLPSGVSRNAAVQVERRWVADSLPSYELLTAVCAIYRNVHHACAALAHHLGSTLPEVIPDPSGLEQLARESRHTKIFKLSSSGSYSLTSTRVKADPSLLKEADAEQMRGISDKWKGFDSIDGALSWLSEMAELMFARDGHHIPLAMLYDSNWKAVDMVRMEAADTTDKYILWRNLAERVRLRNAFAVSFTSELWLRKAVNLIDQPISAQPIIGEQLQICLLTRSGAYREKRWDIIRNGERPRLEPTAAQPADLQSGYLAPIYAAFGLKGGNAGEA